MQHLNFLQPKKVLKTLKAPHPQFLNNAFVDPYSGCEFGCAYCYGLKEETIDSGEGASPFRVGIKTSCAFSLQKELSAQKLEAPAPADHRISIGLGFSSDPYQPCEEKYQLTERSLEIFKEMSIPVQIITKSELVLRDKGTLSEMSEKGLAVVSISLFTLDPGIAKIFEPRVPTPQKRLELIQKLRNEKIVCGAMLMPVFPYLTDSEENLEKLFSALQSNGALYCVPGILSLTQEVVRKKIMRIMKEKFSRIYAQYEALYDKLGRPALNYCQRIEKTLARLSEKYQIPTVLPVSGPQKNASLIVKDSI